MTLRGSTALVVGLVWLSIVAAGMTILLNHEFRQGAVGTASVGWPKNARVRLDGRPVLIMAAHPLCPCTRASIGELTWIMARTRGRVAVYVLVLTPENQNLEWSNDFEASLVAIPGIQVLIDKGGKQSKLFGAETSGATFLYDGNGRLLFHGGITASRGHSGDNIGRDTIVSLINGRTAESVSTPVFGCSLSNGSGA